MVKGATANERIVKVVTDNGPLMWAFFAAYIGAVVYFFQLDQTFWGLVLALIKAAFWPAFVVFEALTALGVA